MKFYNREKELEKIKEIINSDYSEMVYLHWRRRIWKTSLLLRAVEDNKFLYFFVWEKNIKGLLDDFNDVLNNYFNVNYFKFINFRDFLAFLFEESKKNNLIIIFDEFQNFIERDNGIYSDFQYFWDLNNKKMNLKLFFLGSHFSLMKKIFENNKSPLFWRKTASFYLRPFWLLTQIEILKDYDLLNSKNLLQFYWVFWWIPKYIQIFLEKPIKDKEVFLANLLDLYVIDSWFFLFEWKELFALEFWKGFEVYFSILSAISSWKNKKWEIAQFTGISVDSLWKYLQKLESYFELIDRRITVWDKKISKVSYYHIKDSFLIFWFRYIYKYSSLLEIKKFEKLKDFIKTDINVFLWFVLEELFREMFIEINIDEQNKVLPFEFFEIWDLLTKSNIEIDIVLLNKMEKKVLFIESKINNNKIDWKLLETLKEKVEKSWKFKDYKKYYWFVSLDKIDYNFEEEIFLYSLEDYLILTKK
jgi:AAA+ ATPase superfamily predicted ATPase